ncbi:hypothetical protein, partial [uncultured Parasutterella sp.]|uniref:hypothetical protein n=1 Tax=uncultured Parasutterella sp. TaxID=1263098 RepID=UPI002595A934
FAVSAVCFFFVPLSGAESFFSLRDSPWFVIRVTRRSFLHPIFPSAPIFDNINGLNFRQIFGILGVPFNRYY